MKKILLIFIMFLSALAYSATITFIQKNMMDTIDGEAAGIVTLQDRLTTLSGTFEIRYTNLGEPYSTAVKLSSFAPDSSPRYPNGLVGWQAEQIEPNYMFTISAGGAPNNISFMPKIPYTVTVTVDGKKIGSNTTSSKSYWAPTIINNIPIKHSSKIVVTIEGS